MVFSLAALTLAASLSGRILLAVESHGEAWYVNPVDEKRYSLGSPDDAWLLMRSLALGISNADLAKPMPSRLAGRILLAVEDHGKAYYVDPLNLQLFYLGRPADAFRVMSDLGLGITNSDLTRVPPANGALLPPSRALPAGRQGIEGVAGVAFTSQAPFGDWSDPRQQEGCEEASAFMAVKWARGETFTSSDALSAIIDSSDWEESTFGTFMDTSIDDTADRLLKQYFSFNNFEVKKNIDIGDIRSELALGKLVIVPINGTKLNNPNFTDGGPQRHMLVVTGYDASTDEFITNDPGTSRGASYRYASSVLAAALRDYPTGDNSPLVSMPTAMIAVSKETL